MNDTLKNNMLYFPEIPNIGARVHSGILTKESNNPGIGSAPLRTKSIEGTFDCLPVEGKGFSIWGKSISKEGVARLVVTSPVSELCYGMPGQSQVFKTKSGSTYRLDYTTKEEV